MSKAAYENAKPHAALDVARLILEHTNGSLESSSQSRLNTEINV